MSCNKCETKKCSCGKGSTPVMPPSECNTPTCPDPAPCSEIIPTACIQYVGEAKLCGEDEVFAEGDTIGVIEGKIVDYFCERLSSVSEEVVVASIIVTQVDCGEDTVYETGDTIIEALEKTVGYFCTELSNINDVISGLATVASSGAYSDLSGLPKALSDFSNDLLTADELAAINGANTPSALNTFATINDIPTALSELSNDSGFVTKNLYTADDTLTSNRTVTGGGFTLTFDAKTTVKAYSNLSTDTVFNVRNFADSGDLVQIKGNGDAVFNAPNGVEMSYMRANTWNTRNDAIALMTYDQESLGELYAHRRTTFGKEMEIRLQTATTANFRIKNIDNTLIAFNITEVGKVSIPLAQVGNAGLVSGDCYFDTAANILANGDLIMGRKV